MSRALLLTTLLLVAAAPCFAKPPSEGAPGAMPGASEAYEALRVSPPLEGLLLFTGADMGVLDPRSCWQSRGGGVYRAPFDRWLGEVLPGVERAWISTGALLDPIGDGGTDTPERVYSLFGEVGYAAVGISELDLVVEDPLGLAELSARHGVPLTSASLVIHETGETFFPPYRVVELAGRRIAVIAVMIHDPDYVAGTLDSGTIVTRPPAEALGSALQALARNERRLDRVLLVANVEEPTLGALLAQAPEVDAVLANRGLLSHAEPRMIEGRPVLWIGGRGLALGRWPLRPGVSLPPELRSVPVDQTFPVEPMSGALRRASNSP